MLKDYLQEVLVGAHRIYRLMAARVKDCVNQVRVLLSLSAMGHTRMRLPALFKIDHVAVEFRNPHR